MNILNLLQARAELLQALREFFVQEGLLEVETPLLAPSTTTEPYLDHVSALLSGKKYFLQSSPEFAMKRLIAKGSGSIFQICKAFRAEENGKKHRSEFTMIEWYMLDWTIEQLMVQVERLLKQVTNYSLVQIKTYRECFQENFSCNPHRIDVNVLRDLISNYVVSKDSEIENLESFSKDECLNLLFAEKIENNFDKNIITFVYDFPVTQSAFSETYMNTEGDFVAKRFEVYAGGLELANAYQEESSTLNIRKRFNEDNALRKILGKDAIPVDEDFLLAMESGFPKCAGIALGIDRLLMLKLGCADIKDVLSF